MSFQLISNTEKLPVGIEILGYNQSWIDEDYNPDGVCMCFISDTGVWTISKWCGQHDEWHTRYSHEAQAEYGDAEEMLPYIDAPTHWMEKPKTNL